MVSISVRGAHLAALLLAIVFVSVRSPAQEVTPGIDAVDPSVQSRVQDPDKQSQGVILGGLAVATFTPQTASDSSWWYGASPSRDATNNNSRSKQYTSSNTMSQGSAALTWGSRASPSGQIFSNEGRADSLRYIRQTSKNRSRKATDRFASVALSMNMANLGDPEFSAANLSATDLDMANGTQLASLATSDSTYSSRLTRRKVNQFSTRSNRSKTNTFQKREIGEESAAASWQQDSYKLSQLEEERHESSMLIRYGYNARNAREARRKGNSKLAIAKRAKQKKDLR